MSIIDIPSLCRIWKTFLLGFGLLTFLSKKTVYVAEAEGNIGKWKLLIFFLFFLKCSEFIWKFMINSEKQFKEKNAF